MIFDGPKIRSRLWAFRVKQEVFLKWKQSQLRSRIQESNRRAKCYHWLLRLPTFWEDNTAADMLAESSLPEPFGLLFSVSMTLEF